MRLLLCVVAMWFALAAGDDDDSRIPRSPQGRGQRHFGFGGQGFGSNLQLGGGGFGGVNPGFGGVNPGFGGVNPGFGGINTGFGGVSAGFGGVNPGFGGVTPGLGGVPSSGCRYWCKTPEGQAYCCENANQPTNPIATGIVKPGQCQPVRPTCPRVFGPPVTCSNDGACNGVDKCCFDRCLGEHVCKPPLGFGR